MTREEATICKIYLDDLDRTHDCNEYKLLMQLLGREPSEDAVSRQALMEYIKNCTIDLGYENGTNMVLDVISNMPSIQPKTDVLDKIRAEIFEEMLSHNGTGEEVIQAYVDGLKKGLEILDKYKAESEKK